jgi:hypothetical protein
MLDCGWSGEWRRTRDRNVEKVHTAAVLPGGNGFRALMVDTDTWMDWFTYELPTSIDPGSAVAELERRIGNSNGCYRPTERTATELVLRCVEGVETSFQEYRIRIPAERHRVYVMYASIDSSSELASYPAAIRGFEREVRAEAKE